MVTVRKATPDDKKEFSELILLSAQYFPILFGNKVNSVLEYLFSRHTNLFSFEHVFFSDIDGKKTGMILGYNWKEKRRENLKTGLLLFKKTGIHIIAKFFILMQFNATVGKLSPGEYYISNLATYSQYRGKGIGKALLLAAEQEGKSGGAEKIVLDVEKDNTIAVNIYQKLGYKIKKESSISLQKSKILHFYRMVKVIAIQGNQ